MTTRPRRLFAALLAAGVVEASTAVAQVPAEVKPPVVTHHVDAVYPPSALAERKDADVVLTVTVDADGHVSKVDVAQSGGADLDEAAIVAAREWTFVPATRNGKPVASRIKMPFHFAPPAPAPELVETPKAPGEVSVHAAAQGGPAVPPAAPAQAAEPQEVLITGRARPPSRGPSDYVIPLGELRIVPRTNAADFLKLAPGVLVTNEGGEGHADSIILRGFDAGEGEAMELSVGGVPINDPGNFHGNGYADTHFIIPEVVDSLRVLEGPFDPRQGNFAVAGSGDYELGLARRGLTAKQTVGSYGTARTLLAWGPEDQGPHTFAAAQYTQSNGFGENRAFQGGSAIAQYEGKLGDRGLWRLTGQAYSVVAQAAGVIREDDYEAGRIGFYDTYDPNQGQDSSRYSIAADLETRDQNVTLTQQLFIIARSVRIREDFTGYVTDSDTCAPPVAGAAPGPVAVGTFDGTPVCEDPRGTMLDLMMTEQSIGARGSARTHVEAFGQPQELEIGYFARGDSVNNVQYLDDRATQAPYATNASLSGILGDLALYADTSLKPVSWVTLRGGLREELFTYDVEDHCPTATPACDETPEPAGNPRTSLANSQLLPRGSLLLGAFDGFTFVGSFGRGVRSLAIDEVTAAPTPSLATISSYEGGVSYARTLPAGSLSLSSVFYGTQISRDEIFDPTAGRTVDTGATSRAGWTGLARFTGRFFDELANVAAVRGIVDGTDEAIPYVPHVMARSDTALFGDLPWAIQQHPVRASLGPAVTYVGTRSLPFGQTSDGYVLVDAALKLNWRAFELGLTGTNLFDTRYRLSEFTFISDFHTQTQPVLTPERSFTAGAPRMLFLSLSATVGG
jgi:iron complex outermembrane recepter protein